MLPRLAFCTSGGRQLCEGGTILVGSDVGIFRSDDLLLLWGSGSGIEKE